MHTKIYNTFDVVVVPFPFTDSDCSKRRPALILSSFDSFGVRAGHSVMAMITSAQNNPWPLDVNLSDVVMAGLLKASTVRMKLFTLDHRLIIRKAGMLSFSDQQAVIVSLNKLFPMGESLA